MGYVNHLYNYKQWTWLAKRYQEGYSIRALCEFTGLNHLTISKHFNKMGVPHYEKPSLEDLLKRKIEFLKEGDNYGR